MAVRLCAWRARDGSWYGADARPPRLAVTSPFAGAAPGGLYAYEDPGMVGERWGQAGAGMLFVTRSGRMLLLQRSPYVLEPDTWGIPGGAIPEEEYLDSSGQWQRRGMDPLQSALKETEEEVGGVPPHRVVAKYVYSEPSGFSYTTFVAVVDEPFEPQLNWENHAWKWVDEHGAGKLPLHFGTKALLTSRDRWQEVEKGK